MCIKLSDLSIYCKFMNVQHYVGSEIELSDSEDARHSSHQQQLEEFASMKSRCNLSRGSDLPDSEIQNGWHSRSPIRWTASRPQSRKKNVA